MLRASHVAAPFFQSELFKQILRNAALLEAVRASVLASKHTDVVAAVNICHAQGISGQQIRIQTPTGHESPIHSASIVASFDGRTLSIRSKQCRMSEKLRPAAPNSAQLSMSRCAAKHDPIFHAGKPAKHPSLRNQDIVIAQANLPFQHTKPKDI